MRRLVRPMPVSVSGRLNGINWYNAASGRRQAEFNGMELVMLGTAASYPSPHRNVSGALLRLQKQSGGRAGSGSEDEKKSGARQWLFDCGEGTQRQLRQCSSLRSMSIDRLFVTHLHGDHVFGIPGMLATHLATFLSSANATFNIYGPRGIAKFVSTLAPIWQSADTPGRDGRKPRSLVVHELLQPHERPSYKPPPHTRIVVNPVLPRPDGFWVPFSDVDHTVRAGSVRHTVPCLGYSVTEADKPGRLDVAAATARGLLPGPRYADLKAGRSVTLEDGTVLHPSDVVGPPSKGRKVVILGDTCDASGVASLAMDADLLVHEATLQSGNERVARKTGHSTPEMAGEFAAMVGAKKLVLNHFSNAHGAAFAEANVNALASSDLLRVGEWNVEAHPYPSTEDTSGMSGIVAAAQQAAGLEAVVAARDFMAFPL